MTMSGERMSDLRPDGPFRVYRAIKAGADWAEGLTSGANLGPHWAFRSEWAESFAQRNMLYPYIVLEAIVRPEDVDWQLADELQEAFNEAEVPVDGPVVLERALWMNRKELALGKHRGAVFEARPWPGPTNPWQANPADQGAEPGCSPGS